MFYHFVERSGAAIDVHVEFRYYWGHRCLVLGVPVTNHDVGNGNVRTSNATLFRAVEGCFRSFPMFCGHATSHIDAGRPMLVVGGVRKESHTETQRRARRQQ